jgi:hypothetical protein
VRLLLFFAALATVASAQPKGWQVLKDKTGACQMAVPPDWHPNPQLPNMATAPDMSDAILQAQAGKTVRPIPEGAQSIVGVAKMLENTPQRVFWAGKPVSYPATAPPVVGYHVTVPGKGGTCFAQITVKPAVPESLVKQIAETVGPTK